MFSVIDEPLTASVATKLSAGAHKLLNIARLEPQAKQKRLMELTGYSERSVRAFTTELEAVGLVQRLQSGRSRSQTYGEAAPAPLTGEALEVFNLLYDYGLTKSTARSLARHHSTPIVRAAIDYVSTKCARNTPGYLIWCLEHLDAWHEMVTLSTSASNGVTVGLEIQKNDAVLAPAEQVSPTVMVVTDTNREAALLAYVVEATTGADLRVNRDAQDAVQTLYQVGYRAEDVARFSDEVWPHEDWRGQKGERVTLPALLKGIGAVKHLRAPTHDRLLDRVRTLRGNWPEQQPISSLADLWTSVQTQVAADDWADSHCPECGKSCAMCCCNEDRQVPEYKSEDARMWLALIGQLQVQLNRATFNTWVAALRLVGYERCAEYDVFSAAAPSRYVADWLETHLLPAMIQTLSQMQQRPVQIRLLVHS